MYVDDHTKPADKPCKNTKMSEQAQCKLIDINVQERGTNATLNNRVVQCHNPLCWCALVCIPIQIDQEVTTAT